MIAIRRFQPSHAPRLLQLFYEAVHAESNHYYTQQQKDIWASINRTSGRWEQSHDRQTLIAEIDSCIVGFADITIAGEIDHLYVDPLYQRRGIGMQLIAACEDITHQNGSRIITTIASAMAAPLFTKAGFNIASKEIVIKEGVSFDVVRMRKKLHL